LICKGLWRLRILNEGVEVRIEWHLLKPGASFFIPAIQVVQVAREVRRAATEKGIRLVHKPCVSSGMYGVRFWRVA
jgi:hypothetical protein